MTYHLLSVAVRIVTQSLLLFENFRTPSQDGRQAATRSKDSTPLLLLATPKHRMALVTQLNTGKRS